MRHVVDAVRGEIGSARAERAALPRQDELRPDGVRGRGEEPIAVERVQTREGSEPDRTRRFDGRAEPLDHRIRLRDRDARGLVRLLAAHRPSVQSTGVDEPSLLTSWTFDLLQLAPIVLVAVAYAVRARTLARRDQPVPGWRIALFALGLALLVIALASPIAVVAEEELFSFHMTQHLLLGDLAPLCLLAGLTGPMLRPILALPGVMRLRVLANPFVAFPIWAANLVLWHLPVLYEGAVESSALHAVEHAAFFSAGIILWLPVLETLPAPEWFGTGAKLAYIVGVRLVATVIGNVFVWGGSAFYDVYQTGDDYLGLSPDADQSLAGSLMMLEGSLVTIVALAWLFLRMAQEGEVRQELIEKGHDPRAVKRAVRYRRWEELT